MRQSNRKKSRRGNGGRRNNQNTQDRSSNALVRMSCPRMPPMNFSSPPIRKWVRIQINLTAATQFSVPYQALFIQDAADYDTTPNTRYFQVRALRGRLWVPTGNTVQPLIGNTCIINVLSQNFGGSPTAAELSTDNLIGQAQPATIAWRWGIYDQGFIISYGSSAATFMFDITTEQTCSCVCDIEAVFN
jgi:hypothetical protein